jgi:predicted Zn finger-like uncharacterized protein
MTVNCPECRSVFRVDPAKVPATGVRARCSVCGGIIAIAGGTLPVSVTPAVATTAVPTFAGGTSRATPAMPAAASAPGPNNATAVMTPPAPSPAALRATPPYAQRTDAGTPARAATPVRSAAAVATMPTPSATRAVAPALSTPTGSVAQPTPSDARRSINPFLRADPAQRARRLARALVSDLVAYHPQKREDGLRDGTLRQLFREEIKKSYEEYVEQVGRDVAEGSPHFQEALNEILAGGRRLF